MTNKDDRQDQPAVAPAASRRDFLTAAAAVTGPLLVSPRVAFGAPANSRLTADLVQKHGGYQLTAAADYFQDKVDDYGAKAGIAAERRFSGLQGYRRLLQT